MSVTVDGLMAHVARLQVTLWTCQARLAADTDSEALHDLRTTVRRLRSLLRPLRGVPGVEPLERAAKAVGQLTTPMRDREVLVHELLRRGASAAAQTRLAQAEGVYAQVAQSPHLVALFKALDALPAPLRAAQHNGQLHALDKQVRKRLAKQQHALQRALGEPGHDRHELRLLIKRVRYAAEAWPEPSALAKAQVKQLKAAQGALGDWHDHWQWLLVAQRHKDLAPCVAGWQQSLAQAERRADQVLADLR